MSLPRPSDHADRLGQRIRAIVAKASPRRLFVSSVSSGLVVLREADGTVIDEGVAYIGVVPPQVGDAVLVVPLPGSGSRHAAGSRVALGPIFRGASDGALVVQPNTQSFADAPSTSSTSSYADAATFAVFLPPGIWTVDADGGLALIHSAGLVSDLRLDIDGTPGPSRRTQNLSATVYGGWEAHQTLTGVAGNRSVNVKVSYKSFNAGSTSAANPTVLVIARRVV